jgi:hypothetical protein
MIYSCIMIMWSFSRSACMYAKGMRLMLWTQSMVGDTVWQHDASKTHKQAAAAAAAE